MESEKKSKPGHVTISVTDGPSFDEPDINSVDYRINMSDFIKLWELLYIDNKESSDTIFVEMVQKIRTNGLAEFTVNIECCAGCIVKNEEYSFRDDTTTKQIWDIIIDILENGGHVVVADFSAKAMINTWDKRVGECPFRIVSTFEKMVRVEFFHDRVSQECQLNQLATAAEMADSESDICKMDIYAMYGTILFDIMPKIDSNMQITVHSVITGKLKREQNEYAPCVPKLQRQCANLFDSTTKLKRETLENYDISDERYDSDEFDSNYFSPRSTETTLKQICPTICSRKNIKSDLEPLPLIRHDDKDIKKSSRKSKETQYNNTLDDSDDDLVLLDKDTAVYTYGLKHGPFGNPCHVSVTFKNYIGTISISTIHFSELKKITADKYKVIEKAKNCLTRKHSLQIERSITDAPSSIELRKAISEGAIHVVKSTYITRTESHG